MLQQELEPLEEFFSAIKAPKTRRYYEKRLEEFLDFAGVKGTDLKEKARDFVKRARTEQSFADTTINLFLNTHKARVDSGEIQASTLSIYSKPIKLFCDMNRLGENVGISWKIISRKMPHGRQYADDRAPTREEIRHLLEYQDHRIKPIVLTMVSSGIRIGSWEELDWGHIEPIKEKGELVAARMKVYPGSDEKYFTFISGEAYKSLKDWMDYRQKCGERIGEKSPVMRDLFQPEKGARGEVLRPKRLKSSGVKRLIEDALKGTGIRGKLEEGKRRHEFQGAHGFRKFFKTNCTTSGMNWNRVEMLMGHGGGRGSGLDRSYDRPEELFEEYRKALPSLTIMEETKGLVINLGRLEKVEEENAKLKRTLADILPMLEELKRERAKAQT